MGKIFFNPKTGEFWERHSYRRKVPDGFVDTGVNVDWRYDKGYGCDSYFCPECKVYHYVIRKPKLSKADSILCRLGEAFGCSIMPILKKYDLRGLRYVEMICQRGAFDRWKHLLDSGEYEVAKIIALGILKGEDDESIMARIVSRELGRR